MRATIGNILFSLIEENGTDAIGVARVRKHWHQLPPKGPLIHRD